MQYAIHEMQKYNRHSNEKELEQTLITPCKNNILTCRSPYIAGVK